MGKVRDYIMQKYPSCVIFARDVLHWPVYRSGDRVISINPGAHKNKNLQIWDHYWIDFKEADTKHGSVIDLCAWAIFDGDIGAAVKWMAGDFFKVNSSRYVENITRLKADFQNWQKELRPIDRDYLHSRKITDETIKRLQLGFAEKDPYGRIDHRLMIPYFYNGRIVYWVGRETVSYERAELRRRYDAGDDTIDWKTAYSDSPLPAKYKKMKTDEDSEVYNVPWGMHTLTHEARENRKQILSSINLNDWLIICEGAFDALSFEQEGFAVLCSMGGYFNRDAMPMIMDQCKGFKNVLVIYDNDGAGTNFQQSLCEKLCANRINFFCGSVPKEVNGISCKDVSDFYVAGGELADLVNRASRGLVVLAQSFGDPEHFKEFMTNAGKYTDKATILELFDLVKGRYSPYWLKAVKDMCTKAPAERIVVDSILEKHNLLYREEAGFFEYIHGVWAKTSDNQVKHYAREELGILANYKMMTAIAGHLKAQTTTQEEFNTQSCLNLLNGVLLPKEDCQLVPHDPSYMSTIQLPYNYEADAACPRWEAFIEDVTEGNRDKADLLQEIAGYPLFPDNSLEKAFFLIGSGGNGKGVYIDTLRDVYGDENCSALEPSKFNSDFDPIMLRYSLLNICSEARMDMKNAEARFKGIVSGDPITAAHKGVDAIKFRPRCKVITSCNDFMNSNDITHAFLRRLVFVKFTRNYVQMGNQDTNLRAKLRKEIPGILNWCVKGYIRLLENGQFTHTSEQDVIEAEFLESMNPLAAFITEKLMDIYGEITPVKDIYITYVAWCKTYNTTPLGHTRFSRTLQNLMTTMRPGVKFYRRSRNALYAEFPEYASENREDEPEW